MSSVPTRSDIAVPGLIEDIALAAAKIYYLTAAEPELHRLSTVDTKKTENKS